MIFKQLPQELEDHIMEYASDHREKYDKVLQQLMLYVFISIFKKKMLWEVLTILELDLQQMYDLLGE